MRNGDLGSVLEPGVFGGRVPGLVNHYVTSALLGEKTLVIIFQTYRSSQFVNNCPVKRSAAEVQRLIGNWDGVVVFPGRTWIEHCDVTCVFVRVCVLMSVCACVFAYVCVPPSLEISHSMSSDIKNGVR